MKKLLFFVVALLFVTATNTANAQKPIEPMEIGAWTVNAGLGLGNFYGAGGGTGFGIKAALEHGMWEAGPGVITLGGELGWANNSESAMGYSASVNQFSVAARSAWHHGWNVEGLDTYGGFSIGPAFQFFSTNLSGLASGSSNTTHFYFGFFVGASYFFTPNFGVNAEFGYNVTAMQAGIVYKF